MSKIIPKFFGIVENSKLELEDPDGYISYLSGLRGEVEIVVKKRQRMRSSAENRYYWGVIIPMVSEEMGLFKDRVHDFLKDMFLKEGVEVKGKRYEVARSTTDLSTMEFETYAEECRQWASLELNINIPEPNQVDY